MATAPLRIALLTRGGLPGAAVLRTLLASPRLEVALVVRSTRLLRKRQGYLAAALACLRQSGPAYAAYLRAATRWGGFDALVKSRGIALLRTDDVNEPHPVAALERAAPDLVVSAFFNQRIGERVAQVPRLGAVNVHPSPLPRDRGVDPVFRARLRGATTLGLSVHRVTPDWDTGPVLRSETQSVRGDDSVLASTTWLYARGAALVLDALDDLVAGAPGTPQHGAGSYDSWPTRAEVAELSRRGVRLTRATDRHAATA